MAIICSPLMIGVSGCTAAMLLDTASKNIFLQEDINLAERNYAAADYLAGLTHATIQKQTRIEIGTLKHVNQVGMETAFGILVPEHVGARLSQLGYNVMNSDIGGEPSTHKNNGVLITGTYFPSRQTADVNLRLVDKKSGRVLGAFDYAIPINNEISELLEPRPTIFRASN